MLNFYQNLSQTQKTLFLIVTIILSILLGGIGGGFIGLVLTTFIPQVCDEGGCHNAFEWNGKVGYEATGTIGFYAGMIILPIVWIVVLLYLRKKNKIKLP